MVLSSALDSGYVFMALIAILASVISACYYLALVKQIFFEKSDYIVNPAFKQINIQAKTTSVYSNQAESENVTIKLENIHLSSCLTTTISILTFMTLFFILIPTEWLNLANILALILFNC